MRPFLTSPGPIFETIQADIGLGHSSAALLTLIPTLLMGVGAFLSPTIQARTGTRTGILGALCLLMLGLLLRLVAIDGTLLIATALVCGLGVAFIQSAFPGIIKDSFPTRVPLIMGVYSAVIMGGGALGAQATPFLIAHGLGWRAALAWLALPALLALLWAGKTLRERGGQELDGSITRRLATRPRTWLLITTFGLVNAGYSSAVTWLAPFYQQHGESVSSSAGLVAIMAACQAVSAVSIGGLSSWCRDRRWMLCLTAALQATGYLGLALLPELSPVMWVAICGAGLGGSFTVALVTALDHLPSPMEAGALTALMQGGGFIIAAMGPLAMATLLDVSGGYQAGWLMHLGLALASLVLYLRLSPRSYRRAMGIADTP
nr:MFS transporter [Halomonas organivorans]